MNMNNECNVSDITFKKVIYFDMFRCLEVPILEYSIIPQHKGSRNTLKIKWGAMRP